MTVAPVTLTVDSAMADTTGDLRPPSRLGSLYAMRTLGPRSIPFARPGVPFKPDGVIILMCEGGQLNVDIDTRPYTLRRNTVTFIGPFSTATVKANPGPSFKARMLFFHADFMASISLDPKLLAVRMPDDKPHNIINLDDRQRGILKHYFEIMGANNTCASTPGVSLYSRRIAQTLIAGTLYQMLHFVFDNTVQNSTPQSSPSKQHMYVQQFVRLVHTNFAEHRNLDFYARTLCITPKYLSQITRALTGRPAPRWISDMVILEAKNLLRHSGLNIQQVAYHLNFPCQSSFGKYFKLHTGLTPTQFLDT